MNSPFGKYDILNGSTAIRKVLEADPNIKCKHALEIIEKHTHVRVTAEHFRSVKKDWKRDRKIQEEAERKYLERWSLYYFGQKYKQAIESVRLMVRIILGPGDLAELDKFSGNREKSLDLIDDLITKNYGRKTDQEQAEVVARIIRDRHIGK